MTRLRKAVTTALMVAFLGSVVLPAPAAAANVNRTMFGAAGVAAGAMGGTALAAAVTGAAGIAALPPVASLLITSGIVAGCAWVGGKALSHLGLALDDTLGPSMTWTLIGASLGALAALTLFPALGPAMGALAPVVKVLLGGMIGGVLGRLFAPQLESVASPRVLYGAAGGVVGGLAGGVPGALVGAAGGYALGNVMDKGFFAEEDDSDLQDHYQRAQWTARRTDDKFRQWKDDCFDWVNDRREAFSDRVRDQWDYYGNYEDSFYCEGDEEGDSGDCDRDAYYKAYDKEGKRYERRHCERNGDELAELQREWKEALARFEKLTGQGADRAERQDALEQAREAETRFKAALREQEGRTEGGWQ